MGKEKFIYNKETLQYEKVIVSMKEKVVKFFSAFSAMSVGSLILLSIFYKLFPSPREKALIAEIDQLQVQNEAIGKQTEQMGKVLTNIQERDASVHRVMFGMNPMDKNVWNGGTGGSDKKAQFANFNSVETIVKTQEKVEKLANQLVLQSKSLDTIQKLATDREKMFASIPSVKPVREDKLNRGISLLSGFGYRIHPIHKVRKFHKGIDFSAPQGTAIIATGDGVVTQAGREGGYGNCVIINHGFGYQTLYGHMMKFTVKVGEKIKKGQQIGLVGSTGSSTAPHCHYEVHYKGEVVNPVNYCMDGLSPLEYQSMVNAAEAENQSSD